MIDLRFISLIVFLNLPNCVTELFTPEITFRIVRHVITYGFYSICFAFIVAVVIGGIEKINITVARFLKYLVITICATVFLINLFTLRYYDSTINRTMLEILIATNSNEATEFLLAYVFDLKLELLIVAALLIFIAICKIQLPQINKKFLVAILIVSFITVGIKLVKNPTNVFEKGFPITGIAVMMPEVLENMQAYEKLTAVSNHQVNLTRNESDFPLVIFILGESTTRNHMQLYGYNVPTTPNLTERNSRGELKIFSDTVSPHSHTMPVLQKMFTFMNKENENEGLNFWLGKGNFFDTLNAAGYHTVWISNQEFSGIYGNIGRIYAATCNSRNFTRLRDSLEENAAVFDEEILPLLDSELVNKYDKTFCVVHLMGTHSIYNRRYPAAYEKFTAENQTRAEYDNAVLYNDFIIDQIIKRVENLDAMIIYISDHGEDVFDDKDFAGHEENNPSRFMIEVPFVIWTSPKFQQAHPEFESKIAAAVDKPFMTDNMIHLMLDMMKIETADFNPTLSPLNPKYNAARKRIYSGKIYNKATGLK